ncbi:MAG: hypothetical protein WCJ35_28700 [Planctomycetota bacterium]
MLHVALLVAGLLVSQVPPPPSPEYSPGQQYSSDQTPADVQGRREWLLAHLIVDMQSQGKYDAQKYREIESMLNNVSASQLGVLGNYYQQRKSQVEAWQLDQAQTNLRRLEAYRDHLKRELEWKIVTRQQEQAITAYGSALAQQPFQWQLGQIYAAQAWPYDFNRPEYYAPKPHHHHNYR